jgi:hypothetical protein
LNQIPNPIENIEEIVKETNIPQVTTNSRKSSRTRKTPGEWWKINSANNTDEFPSVQYTFMINAIEGTDSQSDKFTPSSYEEAIKYPH